MVVIINKHLSQHVVFHDMHKIVFDIIFQRF